MTSLQERFVALQSPGKRGYQEDDYGLLDAATDGEHTLLVVADGMGGHAGGDTASAVVTETFVETYQASGGTNTERLQAALAATSAALKATVAARPELKGMGSTVVAAVITAAGIEWLSVGDSPLWLMRDGKLQRLNADHSMTPVLQDMVASGRITQEQADADPGRHALLSALLGEQPEMVDVSPAPVPLRRGDLVLLASDGVLTLAEPAIAQVLGTTPAAPVKDLAGKLLSAVERADTPGQDNITILLYRAAPGVPLGVEAPVAPPPAPRQSKLLFVLSVCALVIVIAAVLFFQLPDDGTGTTPAPLNTAPAVIAPPAATAPETGAATGIATEPASIADEPAPAGESDKTPATETTVAQAPEALVDKPPVTETDSPSEPKEPERTDADPNAAAPAPADTEVPPK